MYGDIYFSAQCSVAVVYSAAVKICSVGIGGKSFL